LTKRNCPGHTNITSVDAANCLKMSAIDDSLNRRKHRNCRNSQLNVTSVINTYWIREREMGTKKGTGKDPIPKSILVFSFFYNFTRSY